MCRYRVEARFKSGKAVKYVTAQSLHDAAVQACGDAVDWKPTGQPGEFLAHSGAIPMPGYTCLVTEITEPNGEIRW